jgi:ABC-type sugar transport system ATPase subunit
VLEGELLLIEPIDDRALATIAVFDKEITVAIPSENPYEEGQTVPIDFTPSGFYIFDVDSEELLVRAG